MLLDVAPVLNINLDSEHFNRFRPEVRMSNHLDFISIIRDINPATGVIFSRVSSGDDQPVIVLTINALPPVWTPVDTLRLSLHASSGRSIHR